ncbi:MAG: apolipoprotein N-acyltransferase, partial [Proteobacteria bacterium]|nr:apolipoprotein N-acyltransferase [Pseudomonadota bacterium]
MKKRNDKMPLPAPPAGKNLVDRRLALALLSGLALTLAFPPTGLWFLGWVGLAPILLAVRGVSGKRAFGLGMTMGLAHFLSLTYWVETVMRVYGHLPIFASVPVTLLLCAYLALYPALFAFLYSRADAKSPAFAAAAAPAFWVALEYARAHLVTGFPWALLGYSQGPRLWVIQAADLSGVYLISGLLVLTNAALALFATRLAGKRLAGSRLPSRGAVAGLCLAALALLGADLVYGKYRLAQVDALAAGAPCMKVAVLQGNVDQTVKWDPAYQAGTVDLYSGLSAQAA